MKNLRVKNLEYNGRAVPNQFLITYINEEGKKVKIFQSYNNMILKFEGFGVVEVGKNWNASKTTGKYRNLLTRMKKKEFEKFLENHYEFNEVTQSYTLKKIVFFKSF